MTDRARCRSCGAPILWVVTVASGKRMPLDAEPGPAGNLVLLTGGRARAAEPDDRPPLHTSHFATCPQAAEWRGKKRGGAT